MADTKSVLLDAAEELFAEQGFEKASLRGITSHAGVNLAAVHYHFGSKEELIEAMFARRMQAINQSRFAMLDRCEQRARGAQLDLECVLEAFIGPPMRMSRDKAGGGDRFLRVLGRLMAEASPDLVGLFIKHAARSLERFLPAFRQALPHLSEEELFYRINFMVGAFAHTITNQEKLEHISDGRCNLNNVEHAIARLIPFLAAGMRAPMPRLPRAKGDDS